ncbi:MAG: alpha/beta hydrolase, partial [Mangrovicoccus sp.]|nr:alpha/beta hydrolase [Mangrovicoccus sp.]
MTFFRVTLTAALLATTPLGGAMALEALTPRSAVADLDAQKITVEIPDFRLGGTYDLSDPASFENGAPDGESLESLGAGPLKGAYIAVGTPKTDENGQIINAIVISSYYSGDATAMYSNWYEGGAGNEFSGGALVGPGLLFDTDEFYVVFVDALGLWGASKPSDGLGLDFPKYSYFDMVQANYRLLRDELNIGKVKLATGVSMGATQSYVWGAMHPEFVEAVMPIGGTTASDGDAPVVAWAFQLAKAGLKADPLWQATGGDYYNLPAEQHPKQGNQFHWSMLSLTGYDLRYRQSQGWDAVKGSVFAWEPPEEGFGDAMVSLGAQYDAVDLLRRVEVGETHNINDMLASYEPRTMIVHIENDQWLTFDQAEASRLAIPGAQMASTESPIAHYAVFSALNTLEDDPTLDTFLRDIGVKPVPGKVCDAVNYTSPRVNMAPDPETSFWRDNLTPPFPMQYANVTDESGVEWEIGYMDEACEGIENQETVVLVHGKGAFGAHYGYTMKYLVEQGYRVIAPDMPHAGFSGPGNLDNSFARDFEDMRSAFHGVIVDQLGVDKAWYHGHSLGGQFVLGYALKYPEAVSGLLLEAPAGLEIFPKSVEMEDDQLAICDPAITRDFEAWQAAWGPTGALDSEMIRDEQSVRDFFYFKERDPVSGATSDSFFGYFKNDTEYARLHTDQRIAMISG